MLKYVEICIKLILLFLNLWEFFKPKILVESVKRYL